MKFEVEFWMKILAAQAEASNAELFPVEIASCTSHQENSDKQVEEINGE